MWDNVNRPSPAVNLCNHCPALQPGREWDSLKDFPKVTPPAI